MTTTTLTPAHLEKVVDLLGRVPLFQGLPRGDLEHIAGLVRMREVEPEEIIFREGDEGDRFYVVHSGAVEVLKERPRGEHDRLAVKRAGEGFGEMALLTAAPRSASVRATEPTKLLVLARDNFDALLGGETLAVRLMRGLARALRALDVRFAAREAADAQAQGQLGALVRRGMEASPPPQIDGWQIAAGAGGEHALWDASPLGENGALLAVLDVMGSGLPSAFMLATTRALLREVARAEPDTARVLTRLNQAVGEQFGHGADACVEAAVVTVGDDARLSIAGEQPALLVRAGGGAEDLKTHGPPLGILPYFEYGGSVIELASGDVLVVFSEAGEGLLRGAGDLIAARIADPVDRTAAALRDALGKEAANRGAAAPAFALVKRR